MRRQVLLLLRVWAGRLQQLNYARIPFMGMRISWLMFAKNEDFRKARRLALSFSRLKRLPRTLQAGGVGKQYGAQTNRALLV